MKMTEKLRLKSAWISEQNKRPIESHRCDGEPGEKSHHTHHHICDCVDQFPSITSYNALGGRLHYKPWEDTIKCKMYRWTVNIF